jgi:hypothetical protein
MVAGVTGCEDKPGISCCYLGADEKEPMSRSLQVRQFLLAFSSAPAGWRWAAGEILARVEG